MKKHTDKARIIHGDYYDYSKVGFSRLSDIVTIICPKHGEFEQMLNSHVRGSGCKECGLEKRSKFFRLPLSEFIERSNIIHDNKYDYSKVSYKNGRDRVTIICPKHGEFEQLVLGHLTGYGCKLCGIESKFITNEEFVRRCGVKHNNYYDYSKVVYTDSRNKVTIICPKHGEFEQTAAGHAFGSKCPACSNEARYMTTEEFIEKSKTIHGDLYSYSNVIYKNAVTKVKITCRKHGDYEQIPNSHLCGAGCPSCNSSKGELTLEEIFIKNNITYSREYKIPNVNLRFEYDFYLPEYRTLVEFHGIQHFKPIECFGGEDGFLYIKRNDQFKRHLASQFNYSLIEFDYKQLKTLNKEDFCKLVLRNLAIVGKQ